MHHMVLLLIAVIFMNLGKISEVGYKTINFITRFLPLKNIIVLESKPDFTDNTFALYEELLRRNYNKKYKIYWFLNNPKQNIALPKNVFQQEKFNTSLLNQLKAKWISARAKFIIDCNNFVWKAHKKQKRIHLKHGLPMKDASTYNFIIGETDLISVPSEYWVKVCSKEHRVDEKYIKSLGFPRNDVLQPKPHEHKTVIWMPTWRKHHDGTGNTVDFNSLMPYGLPFVTDKIILNEINELFRKNNAYLLVRLHPAQDTSGINLSEMTNIRLCNDTFLKENNITLYSLLNYTDALISDYSSIYYDYLNLSRPIALAVKDFDEYKLNNGILAKDKTEFKSTYPAVFLEEYSDLISFFEGVFSDDPAVYKCKQAQEKYMGVNDGKAAERIVDYMEEKFSL